LERAWLLVLFSLFSLSGCRKEHLENKESVFPVAKSDSAARENRLLALYPQLPKFSEQERSGLKAYAEGWRRMTLRRAIIGLDPNCHVLTYSFEKHELPNLLKGASPENSQVLTDLSRTVLDAIIYAYKASLGVKWDGDIAERNRLEKLLRLAPSDPIRDSQFALDRMLLVIDDLLEISMPD
jgi:hypothetical protein